MRGWYIDASRRPPPPARVSPETLPKECAEIYAHVPPPGRPITIDVAPFPVDDNITGEEEIDEAVLRLKLHYARGPSGIRD